MKKILIVEDNELLSKALAIKLGTGDIEIHVAADGIEGYNAIVEKKPDLVLLDLKMPRMDGITMLKKVRALQEGRDVHVIILTNENSTKDMAEAVENDVSSFLIKSNTSLDEIATRVKQTLDM